VIEKNDWPAYLRTWRAEHGYSQRKLAARLGVTSRAVELWESESRSPPDYLLDALAWIAQEIKMQ
jgi:transcriptional regulator with XRE-family HTH domain